MTDAAELDDDAVRLLARYLVALQGNNPDAHATPSFPVQMAIRATKPRLASGSMPAWWNALPTATAMLKADPDILGRISADISFDPIAWHRRPQI